VLQPAQAFNGPSAQPEIPSRSPRRNEQQYRSRPPFEGAPPRGSQGSTSSHDDDDGNEDVDGAEDDHESWQHDPVVPLPRKRSPYSPGGLLAPIQERYSMELEREWDAMSRRSARSAKAGSDGAEAVEKSVHKRLTAGDPSYEPGDGSAAGRRDLAGPVGKARTTYGVGSDSRRHGVLMEEDEEDFNDDRKDDDDKNNNTDRESDEEDDEQERGSTPTMSPRPALGASESPGVRKMTGPREMPRKGSGPSRSGGGSGGAMSAHDRLIAGDPSYERDAQDYGRGQHAAADGAAKQGQGQLRGQSWEGHGQRETALRGTVRRKPMPMR